MRHDRFNQTINHRMLTNNYNEVDKEKGDIASDYHSNIGARVVRDRENKKITGQSTLTQSNTKVIPCDD